MSRTPLILVSALLVCCHPNGKAFFDAKPPSLAAKATTDQSTSPPPASAAPAAPGKSAPATEAVPGSRKNECLLRLFVGQESSHGPFGIADGQLGVAVVEATESADDKTVQMGVCIQTNNQQLQLPQQMTIAAPLADALDIDLLSSLCRGDTTTKKLV